MKCYFTLCLAAAHALLAAPDDAEIALVLKNDQIYSAEDLGSVKKEMFEQLRTLLSSYNLKHTTLLEEHKNQIVEQLLNFGEENQERLQQFNRSLASSQQDLFGKIDTTADESSGRLRHNLEQMISSQIAAAQRKIIDKVAAISDQNRELLQRNLGDLLTARLTSAKPIAHADAYIASKEIPPQQPTAQSAVQKPYGVTPYGSFLYWIAAQDGLQFAMTGLPATSSNHAPPSSQGQTYNPNSFFKPGFKFGLSYDTERWGLDSSWTYLYSKAYRNVFSHPPGIEAGGSDMDLWAVWNAIGAGFGAVNYANANWQLWYNVGELTANLVLHPLDKLTVQPAFGFIGAGVHQSFSVSYGANADGDLALNKITNHFDGAGVRLAIEGALEVVPQFSFYAKAGTGLLLGKFSLTNEYNATFDANYLYGSPYINVASDYWSMKPEFDFCLGVRGSIPFTVSNHQTTLHLSAAWDFLTWFDQNQMMKFYGSNPMVSGNLVDPYRGRFTTQHGDLFIQGLTLTAGWEF